MSEFKPKPLGMSVVEGEEPIEESMTVDDFQATALSQLAMKKEGVDVTSNPTDEKLNIENGLISAVLETGDMKTAVSKKIYSNFFVGADGPVWAYMLQHYRNFKKPPELAVIKRKFPDWNPSDTTEPVDYFIEELQARQRYNLILKGMKEISANLAAQNSKTAFEELTRLVSKINTEVQIHRDVLWNEEIEDRIARMEHKMKNFGVDGISYGVDIMDKATAGMHEGELITIVAKSGVGKYIKRSKVLVA